MSEKPLAEILKSMTPLPWQPKVTDSPMPFDIVAVQEEHLSTMTNSLHSVAMVNNWYRPNTYPADRHCRENAAYLAHAANRLPEVVRALRKLVAKLETEPADIKNTRAWADAQAALEKAETVQIPEA